MEGIAIASESKFKLILDLPPLSSIFLPFPSLVVHQDEHRRLRLVGTAASSRPGSNRPDSSDSGPLPCVPQKWPHFVDPQVRLGSEVVVAAVVVGGATAAAPPPVAAAAVGGPSLPLVPLQLLSLNGLQQPYLLLYSLHYCCCTVVAAAAVGTRQQ